MSLDELAYSPHCESSLRDSGDGRTSKSVMLVEGQDCVEQKTFAYAQRVVVLDRAMRTTQFVRKRWLVDDGVPKVQLP